MKRLMCIALGALLIQATAAAAPDKDKSKSKNKGNGKQETVAVADTRVAVHVVFTSGDVRIIRDHYAPRYRNLPPGLRKKVARGGALPPGWQKKYEPFPDTTRTPSRASCRRNTAAASSTARR